MAENRVEDIADVIAALYPVDENDPESHLERLKMVTCLLYTSPSPRDS